MKGTYILISYILQNIEIRIGALGKLHFNKGYYLYVGSAMAEYGSTSLENRIKRHILPTNKKKLHWHIDYLLEDNKSILWRIYMIPSSQRLECVIAQEILSFADSSYEGFGSSDCKCTSHLFFFKNLDKFGCH